MGVVRGILGSLLVGSLALVGTSRAEAKIVGLFDFDGTIVNDKGPLATWRTPWLLKRVDQLQTTYQQLPNRPITVQLTEPEHILYYNQRHLTSHSLTEPVTVQITLPDQIAVSYDEFYRFQSLWAKGDAGITGLKPILLTYDPLRPQRDLLIVPGYYKVFDDTYKYYRDSSGLRPKNYPLLDYNQAVERTELLGGEYSWQGLAFPLFQAMMSHPESLANVQIFTSRGHRLTHYHSLFDQMAKDGLFPAARTPLGLRPVVFSLSSPEARVFGQSLVEKKVDVVRRVVEALYRSAGATHSELHPNPDLAAKGVKIDVHTLIISEDEPSYVDAIAAALYNMSGSYFAHRLKLVLHNTGSADEVANARFPYRWTVFFPARRAREALPEEIRFWHEPGAGTRSGRPGCEVLLATPETPKATPAQGDAQ